MRRCYPRISESPPNNPAVLCPLCVRIIYRQFAITAVAASEHGDGAWPEARESLRIFQGKRPNDFKRTSHYQSEPGHRSSLTALICAD